MTSSVKYDVFVSYSRKDYIDKNKNIIPNNDISKIINALNENNITYWIDEKGIYSGENFTEKIVENIECSKIFIFLSTLNSNASKWTSKEIATADELGKHIIPVRIDKTPYNKSVMFRIADLDFIEYCQIGDKAGIDKLIFSINKALEEIKEKELEEQIPQINEEIRDLEEDIYNIRIQEKGILKQIASKKKLIKENNIICPVCNKEVEYGKTFCNKCGWTFNYIEGILSGDEKDEERRRISIAKSQWNKKEELRKKQRDCDTDTDQLKNYRNLCANLIEKEKGLNTKINILENELRHNRIDLKRITHEKEDLQIELTHVKKEKTDYIKIAQENYAKFTANEELIKNLEKKVEQLEKEKNQQNAESKLPQKERNVYDKFLRSIASFLPDEIDIEYKSKVPNRRTTSSTNKYSWQTPEFEKIVAKDREIEKKRKQNR